MNERELDLIRQYAEQDGEVTLTLEEVRRLLLMIDIARKENLELISNWYTFYSHNNFNEAKDDALFKKIEEC
ncbi:hypothetical protein D3C78_1878100 [compost metagenome]